MEKSTTFTKEVQKGVTLTVEVAGENTDARVVDVPGHPEDLIEVYNTRTGATSRLSLVQNESAESEA